MIGRNILRFAANGTGYYCGNTSLAPHLVGAETDARSPQSDRPSAERGRILIQRARRQAYGAD
jgi:hypothetical protein